MSNVNKAPRCRQLSSHPSIRYEGVYKAARLLFSFPLYTGLAREAAPLYSQLRHQNLSAMSKKSNQIFLAQSTSHNRLRRKPTLPTTAKQSTSSAVPLVKRHDINHYLPPLSTMPGQHYIEEQREKEKLHCGIEIKEDLFGLPVDESGVKKEKDVQKHVLVQSMLPEGDVALDEPCAE